MLYCTSAFGSQRVIDSDQFSARIAGPRLEFKGVTLGIPSNAI